MAWSYMRGLSLEDGEKWDFCETDRNGNLEIQTARVNTGTYGAKFKTATSAAKPVTKAGRNTGSGNNDDRILALSMFVGLDGSNPTSEITLLKGGNITGYTAGDPGTSGSTQTARSRSTIRMARYVLVPPQQPSARRG